MRDLRLLSSFSVVMLIVFAILAPLVSVLQASDVDGMVYVVIPRSFIRWLEGQGYSLGSLSVAMLSPSDYESYSHWLRDVVGKRLEFDFRRVARSWLDFYRSDVGRESLQTSSPIPTISITITLSKDTGDRVLECVAFRNCFRSYVGLHWFTLRYADNTYVSLGWRPLMVEFRIYIDVSGGPPPCYKYCPYYRESEGASR